MISAVFFREWRARIYSAYPHWLITEGSIELIATEIKTEKDWVSGDLALWNVIRALKLSGESNPNLQVFLQAAKFGVVNFEKLRRTLIEINLAALKFTADDMIRLVVPKAITEYGLFKF